MICVHHTLRHEAQEMEGPLSRDQFYQAASMPEVAVAIATGERRIYANLLLTIGVVDPAG